MPQTQRPAQSFDDVPLPFEEDRALRIYSVGLMVTESGRVTALLGKLDEHTRRYSFHQTPEWTVTLPHLVPIGDLLHLVASGIEADPEVTRL